MRSVPGVVSVLVDAGASTIPVARILVAEFGPMALLRGTCSSSHQAKQQWTRGRSNLAPAHSIDDEPHPVARLAINDSCDLSMLVTVGAAGATSQPAGDRDAG
jgi:hypothetical protein